MTLGVERNLGPQPLAALMAEHALKPHDLVVASGEQLTHKTVTRACRGRRLTPNSQAKVLRALNQATGQTFTLKALFSYA